MKAKKTNPKSIRFNIKHLEDGLTKSGLYSPQELVDLLLDNYVREDVQLIEKKTGQNLSQISTKSVTKEISKGDMLKLMREGKM